MNGLVICMNKRPDGRRPIQIKSICGGGRVLYDKVGDREYCAEEITQEIRQMMANVRTTKQLEELKQKITSILVDE